MKKRYVIFACSFILSLAITGKATVEAATINTDISDVITEQPLFMENSTLNIDDIEYFEFNGISVDNDDMVVREIDGKPTIIISGDYDFEKTPNLLRGSYKFSTTRAYNRIPPNQEYFQVLTNKETKMYGGYLPRTSYRSAGTNKWVGAYSGSLPFQFYN